MPSWVAELPFAVAVAALFGIVFARAQGTYWLGRGANAGGRRTRFVSLLEGERMARTTATVTRWGWPVITVSFLTIGFQTLVNAAAGVIRMPWPRYTAAMIPGCVAWAVLYATAGFATLSAWSALAERAAWAPWLLLAVIVGTVAVAAVAWRHRRRSPSPLVAGRLRGGANVN